MKGRRKVPVWVQKIIALLLKNVETGTGAIFYVSDGKVSYSIGPYTNVNVRTTDHESVKQKE
jgi:hypothetical protein